MTRNTPENIRADEIKAERREREITTASMTPKLPRPAKRMILAHVVDGCPRGVEGESQRALEPKPTPRQLNRADGRKEGEKEGRERRK